MVRTRPLWLAAIATLAVLACAPECARAFNVYKVDKDCVAAGAYFTIQAAINAAALATGTNYIWIANNHGYSETLDITNQDLIIEGGFTDCNDFDIGPNDRSSVSGIGGASPVISVHGTSHIALSNLNLSDGTGDLEGGGVRFQGTGTLTIGATAVHGNRASRGGGIYVSAETGPVTLSLLDGTEISGNTASDSGGGIYLVNQTRLLMVSLDTKVYGNHAANYGGGIDIENLGRADIGAAGFSGGVIVQNDADYGGGIAVKSGAVARIFPHDSMHPSSIADNTGTLYGGGIYAEGDVCLFSPSIYDNKALQGAALLHAGNGGIYINAGFPARLGVECGPETVSDLGGEPLACDDSLFCNLVSDNQAATGFAGLYGAIIYEEGGDLIASRLRMQFNLAGTAIQTSNVATDISTSLITDNSVSDAVISIDGSHSGSASFTGSTFAHNTIGGNYVFKFLNGASGSMTRDIIAESPKLSAAASGPLTINYTMSSEIVTLPHNGNSTVVAADPRFVDAANVDYHLRSSSPALDFAPAVTGAVDIEQANRSVDLPKLPNIFGPTDLGAYERQYLCAADQIFCNGFDR